MVARRSSHGMMVFCPQWTEVSLQEKTVRLARRGNQGARLGMACLLLMLAGLMAPSWLPATSTSIEPDSASASTLQVSANAERQLAEALELLKHQPEAAIALLQPLWEDSDSSSRLAAGMGLLRAHYALGQHQKVVDISTQLAELGLEDPQQRLEAQRLRLFAAIHLRDSTIRDEPWAEMEFKQPEPPSSSPTVGDGLLDDPWIHGAAYVLVGLILVRILIALGTGLVSIALYMDRHEGLANVEGEYRRFGLFPRVRYSIWTPNGMIRGSAPAWCARRGMVAVAWRPQHPDWHRPRDLMLEDVLLASSFFFAWPYVVAMRILAALRVQRRA